MRLSVALYGTVIGTLEQSYPSAAPVFTYADGYLATGGAPLSVRLPLRREPYRGVAVSRFLDGLLPENLETRRRWAAELGTDRDDAIGLLALMGWDCPGAVQVCREDEFDAMMSRAGDYKPLTEHEIGERLRRLRADEATWTMPDEHWSLPGQQEKFTLAQVDGEWRQALGSAPTTHIVKPGIGRLHHQALVEHATMRAAAAVGVAMATTEFCTFDDQTAIVVSRFDRVTAADGTILRIHQEDFCQATGFAPEHKYEAPRGPGLAAFAKVIADHSTDPATDRRALADFLAINYVAGAPDGHSKNISLALLPDAVRVAPLYDLATAFPYDSTGALREVAVSIGGRRKFGQVLATHWDRAATQLRITPGWLRERVLSLATDFPDAYASVLGAIETPEAQAILTRSQERLARHCADIVDRLSRGGG